MLKEITEEEYEQSHKNSTSNNKEASKQNSKNEQVSVNIPLSFLMSGNDLVLSKNCICKHPTYQEIIDIDKQHLGFYSETVYYSYVSLFVADPYDYMVMLDDNGIDYEKISSFHLFIFLFEKYMQSLNDEIGNYINQGYSKEYLEYRLKHNIYYSAFDFFFGIDSFLIGNDKNGEQVLTDFAGNILMNEESYEFVHEFIKSINGITVPKDRIYPENDAVKKMLIDDMREEKTQKEMMRKMGIPDESDDNGEFLGKQLSSVTWIGGGGITPFNRAQLHIFDITDGYRRLNKKADYDNTILGIYTRCINPKTINFKEVHWAN